jgi:GTP-binding protein
MLRAGDVSSTGYLCACACLQGWASTALPPLDGPPPSAGMQPLLDVLLQHVPPPQASPEEAFAMCVAMIERDPFMGRIATGAAHQGQP